MSNKEPSKTAVVAKLIRAELKEKLMAPIIIFDLQNFNYDEPANDQREIELLPNEDEVTLAIILLAEDLAGFCLAHGLEAEPGWWEREDQARYGVTWQPNDHYVTVFANAGYPMTGCNKTFIIKYAREIINAVDSAALPSQQFIENAEIVMKIRKRLAQEDVETVDVR